MSKPRDVTPEDLEAISSRFYLKDGKLFYKNQTKRQLIEAEVGLNTKSGERKRVNVAGKKYIVSRIVYFLHYGNWPKGVVDHKNGDHSDDTPENLRDIPKKQNSRSYCQKRAGASSKFRGVTWHKGASKWSAKIQCNGRYYNLGLLESDFEAALAYNYKALDLDFNREAFNLVF